MWNVGDAQWQNPSFAEQGIGIDEALFELGLVNDAFYDTIRGAARADIEALESWWGSPLPTVYRRFLGLAGGSLGNLRIRDWRTDWEFRPDRVLAHAIARGDQDVLRESNMLPIAVIGEAMDFGYDGDVCLFFDTVTEVIQPEDDSRPAYEDLVAFLLEWGHRALDPQMATPIGRLRSWSADGLTRSRIGELHGLCASFGQPDLSNHVGRALGVYRYPRSGVLIRMDRPDTVWVEAYRHERVAPERTAAASVLRFGKEKGWLRS